MAKICAFVFNSVSRDARVLREAASLASQGHNVTVIGLSDKNYKNVIEKTSNGVEIRRVNYADRAPNRKVLYFIICAILICLGLFMISVYFYLYGRNIAFDVNGIDNSFLSTVIAIIIALMTAFAVFFASKTDEFKRIVFGVIVKGIGRDKWIKSRGKTITILLKWFPDKAERYLSNRIQPKIDGMAMLAEELCPEIIHCHDIHTLPICQLLKERFNCKVVYDAHEIYEEVAQSSVFPKQYYRSIHNKYIPFVDGFITINESIGDWYKKNYAKLPYPTIIMNATAKESRVCYDNRLHEAANVDRRSKILLYQGGFATKRGLEYLVRAAEFLPSDWVLVMMGWGSNEERLREVADGVVSKASAVGRESSPIRFIPPAPQSELALWTAGATVGIIPYENVGLNHWFCTPNKLWEYPNAGVPVLVSPFPELRKPVEKYGYGWLLPEEQDPKALAQQVAELTDEELAAARKACAVFIENESWEKYEKRLFALYDSLLSPAPSTEHKASVAT